MEQYCTETLNHAYMEIDELSGYDRLKEEIESKSSEYESKQIDVYLYQSEFHKNTSIKEIVEYCLSCRVFAIPSLSLDQPQ